MSRGKLYAVVGSLGIMVVAAALTLTLVFSRDGASPAGGNPGPGVATAGLAQASGETAASGGGPAKALPTGGPVSASGLEAVAAPAPPSGGAGEGIQVHGRWTIEVREPDGRLVSRTEFQNALTSVGQQALAQLLARESSAGHWSISVGDDLGNPPCVFGVVPSGCTIIEATSGQTAVVGFQATNLQVARVGGSVELSGSVQAGRAGQISFVGTRLLLCVPSTSPLACATSASIPAPFITSHPQSPFIPVQNGQIIQAIVTISFS